MREAAAGVRAKARRQSDGDDAQKRDGDDDERERPVVEEHQKGVEQRHHEIDRRGGQLPRHDLRHLVVDGYATADLARIALPEVGGGQPEDVVEERARRRQGQLRLETEQVVLLQPLERPLNDDGNPHGDEQPVEQPRLIPHQVLVDEDARKGRDHETGNDQEQPGQNRVHQRPLGAPETTTERRRHAWCNAALLEVRTGLEGQHHARVRTIQLFQADGSRTLRGVVDEDFSSAETFEDHEVVEVPEEDDGELQRIDLLETLVFETLGGEPVLSCSLENVAGLASITRHATLVP